MATSSAQLRQSLDYIITQLHQLQSATQDLNTNLLESGASEDIIERKMSEFQIDSMLELQTLINTTISNFDTQRSAWLRLKVQSLKFPLSLTDAEVQRQLIALFEQIEIQLENETQGSVEKREELVRSVPENLPELVRQMEQHQGERAQIHQHWKELFKLQMEQQRRRIIYTIEHLAPEIAKRYKDTGAYQEVIEQITELVNERPENRRRSPQQLTAELTKKIAQTQFELTDGQARAARQTDNTIALLANPNIQKALAETLTKAPLTIQRDPAAFERLIVDNILGLEALPEEGTWRQYRSRPEPREIARQFVSYVASGSAPAGGVPVKSVLSQTIRELDQERNQTTTPPARRLELSNVLAILSIPHVAQTLEHSLTLGADSNQPVNETVKSTVAKISQAPEGQRIPVLGTRTIEEVANKMQTIAANTGSAQAAPKVVEQFANAASTQLKQDLKNRQNRTELSQARLAKAQQLLHGDQTVPKDADFNQLVQTTVAIAQQTQGVQTSHAAIRSSRDATLIETHVRPVLGSLSSTDKTIARADMANTERVVSDRTRRETAVKAINAAQMEIQSINTADPEVGRAKAADAVRRAEKKLRAVGLTPKTMPASIKNALSGLYAQLVIKDGEPAKTPQEMEAFKAKANRDLAETMKHLERIEASLQLSHEGLISTIDQASGIPTAQKDALIFSLVEYRADTRTLIKQLREGKISHYQFNLRQRQLQGRYLRTIGRIHPYIPADLRDLILNTALTLPMVFQGTRLFTPKEAAQFKAETGKTAPTHHLGVAAGRDTWLGYRPMSTRPQVFNPGNMSAIGYLPQPGTPGGGILNQALSIGRILAGGQGGVGASVGGGFVRAGLTAARGLIFGLSPATLAAAVGLIVLALVLVLLVAGTNNAPKYALFPTQTNEYQGFGADAPDVQKALAGGYFVQSFVYDGPLPPASEITQCPLDPSQIVAVLQCPGGSYSHKVVDAYDFSAFAGQPVRASHDGFIALIGYDGTYGNQVRIVSQTSSGKRYMTIYGHFKTVDPIVYEIAKGNCPEADKYNGTCLVRAGTVIGYVDSTGHSEGNHLHYEYRGPGVLQLPNNYCVGSDKYKIECTPVYPPNIVRE